MCEDGKRKDCEHGMKKYTIAFDCDGTLVTTDSAESKRIVANERIRTMLIAHAHCKNSRVIVWSGGGEMWARQVVRELGLTKYVDLYADKGLQGRDEKGRYIFEPTLGFKPDIAVDDIQSCELGRINIIVREK